MAAVIDREATPPGYSSQNPFASCIGLSPAVQVDADEAIRCLPFDPETPLSIRSRARSMEAKALPIRERLSDH